MGNVGNRQPRRTESSATHADNGFVTIHWDQVLKALRRPTCRSGFGLIGGGLTGFAWPYFPQFQGSTLFAVMFTYGIIRVAALLGSRVDSRGDRGIARAHRQRLPAARATGAPTTSLPQPHAPELALDHVASAAASELARPHRRRRAAARAELPPAPPRPSSCS